MTTPKPRLFLVAPRQQATTFASCVASACEAGDIASLLLPPDFGKEIVQMAQAKGLAVLIDGDAARAKKLGADGVHIDASLDTYEDARGLLGRDAIVGAYCAASRHAAMEMAEAGADYLALAQDLPSPGEPILGWCADLLEAPCIAFDPVAPDRVADVLQQRPEFIRPSDDMWVSAAVAWRIISETMLALEARP
jgi:thiamine-phosphate pyrophosphorylase